MTTEIYKDVIGYEGLYQVSNLGNVKSQQRIKIRKRNGNLIIKEKILKPTKDMHGYLRVGLSNGKLKIFKIHKLVAISFLNHVPNGYKIVVDHKNNIKTDNRAENLQLVTNRENTSKDRKNGSSKYVGVSWANWANKWRAQIWANGKPKKIGYFKCEHEAGKAYQRFKELIENEPKGL